MSDTKENPIVRFRIKQVESGILHEALSTMDGYLGLTSDDDHNCEFTFKTIEDIPDRMRKYIKKSPKDLEMRERTIFEKVLDLLMTEVDQEYKRIERNNGWII